MIELQTKQQAQYILNILTNLLLITYLGQCSTLTVCYNFKFKKNIFNVPKLRLTKLYVLSYFLN